ncbi:glycosyltransferase [Cytobacillus sp. Sa5YUA1]|uniref:Glycosyltransferase n=1 Tax=Cytobacillus stercorigallinarum TaxID=2762240 RepID=A0ABR8QLX8_9BACI|nr:glycosyltransferase [Cytobacillus stercorigallinarum]MBD7936519.1 glycosyltransferase [Cytobacillus stercorigallinarum]
MKPLVSVVIPFYNCQYVDQAIESVLQQTYKNIELIVVDDGSTEYVNLVQAYKNKLTYIYQRNKGTAAALNTGIKAAKGKYIAWLSADDLFVHEKIEKQVDFMENRQLSMSFTNYDIINENNEVVNKNLTINFLSTSHIYETFLYYNPVNGCTVMIKKDVFNELGYFNARYKFTQDYDMWLRVVLAETSIAFINESLTKYRAHSNSTSAKNQPAMKMEIRKLEAIYRRKLRQLLKKWK